MIDCLESLIQWMCKFIFSRIYPFSLPENSAEGCGNLKNMAIYPFYCDNPELGARCRISTYVMRFLSYRFNHPDSGSVHE